VLSGLGRAALLRRAIERDPSVGQEPTRGPAIIFVCVGDLYETRSCCLSCSEAKETLPRPKNVTSKYSIMNSKTLARHALYLAHQLARIRDQGSLLVESIRKSQQGMRNTQ
jgi:hypothetical protein